MNAILQRLLVLDECIYFLVIKIIDLNPQIRFLVFYINKIDTGSAECPTVV